MVINYVLNSGVFNNFFCFEREPKHKNKNWKINNHILFLLSYFTLDNLLLKKNNG